MGSSRQTREVDSRESTGVVCRDTGTSPLIFE